MQSGEARASLSLRPLAQTWLETLRHLPVPSAVYVFAQKNKNMTHWRYCEAEPSLSSPRGRPLSTIHLTAHQEHLSFSSVQ